MNQEQSKTTFQLKFIPALSTFDPEGHPIPIPYIVDGLFVQGGFSILAAKPKVGKSSLARYVAVCVAKGLPFLGRDTVKGEAIIISLEDPLNHADNCLGVLGYDPSTDGTIHLVNRLSPDISESLQALEESLSRMPKVRLVVVDTLSKLLRVKDITEYMNVLSAVERLRNLAVKFPHLHVMALQHCKKVRTDDPFDALLGSTALRGEADTTIALYDEKGQRVIATETRIGRTLLPTILKVEMTTAAGADVVRGFALAEPFEQWQSQQSTKTEKRRKLSYEERIVQFLSGCENDAATQKRVFEEVEGKTERLVEAVHELESQGAITMSGTRHSPSDPLTLTLNRKSLPMYDFINRFNGRNTE